MITPGDLHKIGIDAIQYAEYKLMGYTILKDKDELRGHKIEEEVFIFALDGDIHRHDGPAYMRGLTYTSYYLYGSYMAHGDWLRYKHMTRYEFTGKL